MLLAPLLLVLIMIILGMGRIIILCTRATTPAIHNGADDNASGTAALIELSKLLKGF